MMDPRLYSLSTVGIIKHYVHDYLMHAERTDFVGSNGVGKSIIADLLQILFVYDSNLIRFGTDGVNKKERSVHTLPYKQPHAYFFANVELKENVFVLIGVMIPARTGSRLIPFVITRNSDLNKGEEEIGMELSEILLAKDFILNGGIPDLKTLAQQLFDKGFYLKFYRNKEDVREYYQFLYSKRITPINLANEDNLRAFAKVIQSFSKAKSLDLDSSSSIKQFLFDDSDKDFIAEYDQNKAALEKLLRQYEHHLVFIRQLEKKQERLIQLREMEETGKSAYKAFRTSELGNLALQYHQIIGEVNSLKGKIKQQNDQLNTVKDKISRIPSLEDKLNEQHKKAEDNNDLITKYNLAIGNRQVFEECVSKLKIWRDIKLSPETIAALEFHGIEEVDEEAISATAGFAFPFLSRYGEWQVIESKYHLQKDRLLELTNEIKAEIAINTKWIELLEKSDDSSLINWVLQNPTKLTPEQQAVVVKYFDFGIDKPLNPSERDRYVKVPDILLQRVEMENDQGFWLDLGVMVQFIEFDGKETQWTEDRYSNLEKFISVKKAAVNELSAKLKEIENIKKGAAYDRKIILEDFDLGLIEYSNVKKINEGLSYIAEVGKKIKMFEKSIEQINKEILAHSLKLTGKEFIPENTDLTELFAKKKVIWMNWLIRLARWKGSFETQLNSLESSIKASSLTLNEMEQKAKNSLMQFDNANNLYGSEFGQVLSLVEFSKEDQLLEKNRKDYERFRTDYELKYTEAVALFEDTRDKVNTAVNLEVEARGFSFDVLEKALLGNQIKHTDEIGPALQQANLTLLSIADNVRDSMGKIFNFTIKTYYRYEEIVKSINSFFKSRKISNRFIFKVEFEENKILKIRYLENLGAEITNAYKRNEIPFGHPVSEFVENFVKDAARLPATVKVNDLLNPKTYFDLSVKLTNEKQGRTSGSTGETYSAIALLGVARLSLVQTENDTGLRFIILEETGSLDNINFSTFPEVARKYGYQIITMAPRPFGVTLSDEWYLHYLIKGKQDEDINHHPTASFFYTNSHKIDLGNYLEKQKGNELD